MIDAIKKVLLAGVGAAAVTTEKAEKALKDLVDKGKLSADDAKEAAKKLADDGKQEFDQASKKLEETFDGLASRIGKEHDGRIEKLEAKVAELEQRLAELADVETVASDD